MRGVYEFAGFSRLLVAFSGFVLWFMYSRKRTTSVYVHLKTSLEDTNEDFYMPSP